jgi:hypothetical protein
MVHTYSRRAIPDSDWTDDRTDLFASMKVALTSSPLLARFDSSKPVFLKTDWSAACMGFIIMQPDGSEVSMKAMAALKAGEDNAFDTAMTGARLQPIKFGSRKCTESEQHYHSMVGESACGRWAFGKCRRYLFGAHFFWMCECDAVKKLFEYDEPIPQLKRRGQEMLGYKFTLLHRSCRNMRDVDAINRQYDNTLIRAYMSKGATLHNTSMLSHPESYAVPSLRYLTKKLAAEAPPTTAVLPPATGLHVTSCLTISTPQTQSALLGVEKSYKPVVHCEAALNHLVQLSIQQQSIAWVSLNAGFPTIPLRLSEVCRDFQFHLAGEYPAADQKRLSTCFTGTTVVQHNVTGSIFLNQTCSSARVEVWMLLARQHHCTSNQNVCASCSEALLTHGCSS